MKKNILVTLCFFTLFSSAYAGVLIEPFVGYRLGGTLEESGGNADKDSYSYSGLGYGARLGYDFLGLMFGAEYSVGSSSVKQTEDPTPGSVGGKGQKVDTDFKDVGLFVGYNFPVFLRAWGSYYFSSKMDVTGGSSNTELSAGNPDNSEYSGSGYNLGLGFTGLPFLSINLEYRKLTYDDLDVGATSLNLPNNNHATYGSRGKLSRSEVFLGVSLPLDF